jgi:hypothetical protein
MLILKVEELTDKGLSPQKVQLGYRAIIGQSAFKPMGGLHILAHAKESQILDTAWASIRLSRASRSRMAARAGAPQKVFPILDAQLCKEWLRWKSVFEFFLRGTLDNVGIFPRESKAILERAVMNLEEGTMVKLCQTIKRERCSPSTSRRGSRIQ